MKISQKIREKLYFSIHDSITDLRIQLKLSPKQDFELAQLEHKIWDKQKLELGLVNKENKSN